MIPKAHDADDFCVKTGPSAFLYGVNKKDEENEKQNQANL